MSAELVAGQAGGPLNQRDAFRSPPAPVLCSLPSSVPLCCAGHVSGPPCTVSRVCPLVGLRGQSGGCPCLARGQRLCSGQVLVPQPSPVFAAGTAQGQGRAGCSLCRHGTRGHTAGGTAGDGPRPSPGLTGGRTLCPSYQLQSHLRRGQACRGGPGHFSKLQEQHLFQRDWRGGGDKSGTVRVTIVLRTAGLAHQRPCLAPAAPALT